MLRTMRALDPLPPIYNQLRPTWVHLGPLKCVCVRMQIEPMIVYQSGTFYVLTQSFQISVLLVVTCRSSVIMTSPLYKHYNWLKKFRAIKTTRQPWLARARVCERARSDVLTTTSPCYLTPACSGS